LSNSNARLIASFIAGGLCFAAGGALSQATAFPIILTTFSPNTPAVAADVNRNFAAVKSAVEQMKVFLDAKIGPIDTAGAKLGATSINGYTNISNGGLVVNGATSTLALNVSGGTTLQNVVVTGELVASGIKGTRLVETAPFVGNNGPGAISQKMLDPVQFRGLCGDADGCTIRLVLQNFSGTRQDASLGPVHFEYDLYDGTFRAAHTNYGDANMATWTNVDLRDGDGNRDHAMKAWNCYLTDAEYRIGGGEVLPEVGNSMYLLNFNDNAGYKADCMLIIDD
jgi:hypothetical protein